MGDTFSDNSRSVLFAKSVGTVSGLGGCSEGFGVDESDEFGVRFT